MGGPVVKALWGVDDILGRSIAVGEHYYENLPSPSTVTVTVLCGLM